MIVLQTSIGVIAFSIVICLGLIILANTIRLEGFGWFRRIFTADYWRERNANGMQKGVNWANRINQIGKSQKPRKTRRK